MKSTQFNKIATSMKSFEERNYRDALKIELVGHKNTLLVIGQVEYVHADGKFHVVQFTRSTVGRKVTEKLLTEIGQYKFDTIEEARHQLSVLMIDSAANEIFTVVNHN